MAYPKINKYPVGSYRMSKEDPALYVLVDGVDIPYVMTLMSLNSCEISLEGFNKVKNLSPKHQLIKAWVIKRICYLKTVELLKKGL